VKDAFWCLAPVRLCIAVSAVGMWWRASTQTTDWPAIAKPSCSQGQHRRGLLARTLEDKLNAPPSTPPRCHEYDRDRPHQLATILTPRALVWWVAGPPYGWQRNHVATQPQRSENVMTDDTKDATGQQSNAASGTTTTRANDVRFEFIPFAVGAAIWLLLYAIWLPHVYGGGRVVGHGSWLAVSAIGLVLVGLSCLELRAYRKGTERVEETLNASTMAVGTVMYVFGAAVVATFTVLIARLLLPLKAMWWLDRNLGFAVSLVMVAIGLTVLTTYQYQRSPPNGSEPTLIFAEAAWKGLAPFAIVVFCALHSILIVFFIARALEASALPQAAEWLDSNFRLAVNVAMATVTLAIAITYYFRRAYWKYPRDIPPLMEAAGIVAIASGAMPVVALLVLAVVQTARADGVLG
jgi:hypothetical protein